MKTIERISKQSRSVFYNPKTKKFIKLNRKVWPYSSEAVPSFNDASILMVDDWQQRGGHVIPLADKNHANETTEETYRRIYSIPADYEVYAVNTTFSVVV